MHQVGRELDNVVEVTANALKDGVQVVEHLLELRVEIADPGDAAVSSHGKLAGDEEQRTVAYFADVRIEALRSAGAFRVQILDGRGGHRWSPNCLWMGSYALQ